MLFANDRVSPPAGASKRHLQECRPQQVLHLQSRSSDRQCSQDLRLTTTNGSDLQPCLASDTLCMRCFPVPLRGDEPRLEAAVVPAKPRRPAHWDSGPQGPPRVVDGWTAGWTNIWVNGWKDVPTPVQVVEASRG
eukprot:239983-Chlamydomonas_euryale.AAC.2